MSKKARLKPAAFPIMKAPRADIIVNGRFVAFLLSERLVSGTCAQKSPTDRLLQRLDAPQQVVAFAKKRDHRLARIASTGLNDGVGRRLARIGFGLRFH
ncbi:hypothetical protein [Nitratireductor aquibiodomus]|uniref:hypothetical protein n=1 Tax=Nitratireductor aquibiodomus TaxID=204799 RepID=UPI0012DE88FC|nr:hypothetical protein [Nitratireductor aquibiodomus]